MIQVPELKLAHLLWLTVIGTAVPLLALAFWATTRLVEAEHTAVRDVLMDSSRALAAAVDSEIVRFATIAEILARSERLQNNDLKAFRDEAMAALHGQPDTHVTIADLDGQLALNTAATAEGRLPQAHDLAAHQRTVAISATQVSDIHLDVRSGQYIVAVQTPVFKEGRVPRC